MKEYIVKLHNPKTGNVEVYITEAKNMNQLIRILEVFQDGGYEVLSYREIN